MSLSERYCEMMELFDEIKAEVRRRDPNLFDHWKAYGFELDDTFVSMGPNLGDIVEQLDEEDEDEDDEEENLDWAAIDYDTLSEEMKKCCEQAIQEGKTNLLNFVAECQDMRLELRYYRGRNFFYGPAVAVDSITSVGLSKNITWQYDQLGKGFIVYPTNGLTSNI